jgi:translation initiation factor IF-2
MTLEKMKVYELAKELGLESIALLERLKELDIDVKSHMSSLGSEEIKQVRDVIGREKQVADKTAKAVAKKAAAALNTVEKRVTSTVIRRRAKGAKDDEGSADEMTSEKQGTADEATPAKKTTKSTGKAAAKAAEQAAASTETPKVTVRRRSAKSAAEATEDASAAAEQSPVELRATSEPVSEPPQHKITPTEQADDSARHTATETFDPAQVAPPEPLAQSPTASDHPGKAAAAESLTPSALSTPKPTAAQPARRASSSFSFDIIKVIPKSPPPSPVTTANTRPLPKPGAVPLPVPRPKGVPKPAATTQAGTQRPGFNRNTYHRPSAGGPAGRPTGPRPPGSFGGAPSNRGAAAGYATPFPAPGPITGSRHAADKNRFNDEENVRRKTGSGRGERPDQSLDDVKLIDYRAKKEIIFLPKKKKILPTRELKQTMITTPADHKRVIRIENTVTVADLAARMSLKTTDLIKKLIGMGVMANMNQQIDFDTATLLASDFGFEIENVAFKEDAVISSDEDADEAKSPRPPIVTVMGHVDHGKTSLLDAIRKADVAAGEAGGITQHIGAYSVELDGRMITFIDTPGHEAFTQMRARGANVTDIVILVVAADDGIMPQTREAIDHAKSAGVPIIVAINKIDKPTANRERVLKELAELDLLPEEWGGQVMVYDVSALKQTGIKELLEGVLLQAEMLDLKANPDRMADGTVLEAKLDRSRGPTATVLVKRGTLRVGDVIVAGLHTGRVRAMVDHRGQPLKEIGPSMAAEILGLENVPTAGDNFNVVKDESAARSLQNHRKEEIRRRDAAKQGKLTLDEIFGKIQKGDLKELPVLLKTDVFGSTEAIKESLLKLSTPQVKVKILSAAVGGISESDVLLASASNALIFGFNVRPDNKARQLAEQENVEIKTYEIIYELIDDVKKAMSGLLPKKAVERYLGRAEVRNVFSIPSVGVIAGCGVIDGKIQRNAQVRLLRENRVIYTGNLASLRRFKDDAKEVTQGYECGISIENYRDLKVGDVIEAFTVDMIEQDIDTVRRQEQPAQA